MKYTLMMLLLCLVLNSTKGQDTAFYICIADANRIIGYNSGVPEFDDPDINNIFSNYTVTYFAKSTPLADDEYLRKWYEVHCDSAGLAEELYAFDSTLFTGFHKRDTGRFLAHYPSDWNGTHNDTDMFKFIKAPGAWQVSKGDSNLIIGVLDGGFNSAHPDMGGKYASVPLPNASDPKPNHGVFVAGLLAARTNNGSTGTVGMGYNCRLHAAVGHEVEPWYDIAMDTALFKKRVMSCSWSGFPHQYPTVLTNLDPLGYYDHQEMVRSMYERGIVLVAAAGNGNERGDNRENPRVYQFPASYDYVLSVTGVGHLNTSGTKNIQYMHEFNVGDSSSGCYQHNYRVDLSAPAYEVSSHYNDVFNAKYYSYRENSGTSFSAPLVAGTAALILAKKPWLTPYQVEYILKKSSVDIYNLTYNSIAYNQRYAGPTRWTGRLGAGLLDAEAALNMTDVDMFFQNHPDARTFRIKGVKLNTKCAPGTFPGVPNPRVEVIMENGTPPYTYKWEKIPNENGVVITPLTNAIGTNNIVATVTSLTTPSNNNFAYRLTVYDNSEIQKVASKKIKFKLNSDATWDLAMQDAYADLYDEPNEMLTRSVLDWDIWSSPDIWNRLQQDWDTVHQNPDHTQTHNHMYVRVKNVGCVASPSNPEEASLELYWTIASTGETWPDDWTGQTKINSLDAGGRITPANGIAIGAIAPGGQAILSYPWQPPVPQDFDSTLNRMAVCALARIFGNQGPPYGMTFGEIDTTKVNVRNNNNVVTRNFESINLNPPGPIPPVVITPVIIGNPSGGGTGGNPTKGPGTFSMQLITENQLQPYMHGYLATYMDVVVHMGDLYDIWNNGGGIGNHTSFSDIDKSVTWDMQNFLRLENIVLNEGERHLVKLEFRMKNLPNIPYDVNDLLHLRLISPEVEYYDNGDGTTIPVNIEKVHSAVNYAINIPATDGDSKPAKPANVAKIKEVDNWFEIHPNPVKRQLTLTLFNQSNVTCKVYVTDVMGRRVADDEVMFKNGQYNMNTSFLNPGIYHVQITDKTGKTSVRKFVKVD